MTDTYGNTEIPIVSVDQLVDYGIDAEYTLVITTKQYLLFEGNRYNILSAENVKGRGMYTGILAKRVEASNG